VLAQLCQNSFNSKANNLAVLLLWEIFNPGTRVPSQLSSRSSRTDMCRLCAAILITDKYKALCPLGLVPLGGMNQYKALGDSIHVSRLGPLRNDKALKLRN
jgi:hypothetical protein